jgi:hypothetical protein
VRVKQAKLKDYVSFKGSDGDTSSEVERGDGEENKQNISI